MEHKAIKNDIGKHIIETFENENLKATHYILTGETEIKFKSNCPKKIKEMWKLLNKPYDTKILRKSR